MYTLELHLYMSSNLIYSYHSNFIAHSNLCNNGRVLAKPCAPNTDKTIRIFMSCAADRYNQDCSTSLNVAIYSAICHAYNQV